jgi:hypothetical protein
MLMTDDECPHPEFIRSAASGRSSGRSLGEIHDLTKAKDDSRPSFNPLTGGYYWFPTQTGGSISWDVLTCQDLGYGPDDGHFDLWPSVIDRLASAWNRDQRRLRRLLSRHCYGLPRGRVTRPEQRSLVLHGHDSPVPDWLGRVVGRFDLDRRSLKTLFDEHERTFAQDRRTVYAELGLPQGRHPGEVGETS